jgi:D-beta-D-heptose 7-phosphate kinase / D-beta-D-heptose 1-phosphate adenosyltransferase
MDISTALAGFSRQTLLVLGDVFVDEYLTGDCSRLSPEAPVPILHIDEGKTKRVPGGAANTAANITSLGGSAVLIGLIGEDAGGEAFQALMRKHGVRLIPVSDGRPTILKTRLVGSRQQLLRMDREDTRPISAKTIQFILAALESELPACSAVVIPDYAKGILSAELFSEVLKRAHAAGKSVIVDPRPQHAKLYVGCDYLTPNWKESLGLLGEGESLCTPEALQRVGKALVAKLQSNILLTLGPQGMAFFGRDGEHFAMPTVAREVYDVSGAGDTVVAAFALAHAVKLSHADAASLANRAAGVVVGKLGTATVTREELLAYDAGEARLLSRTQLAPLARALKAQGKRIVTLNGSFDLLHAGHVFILEQARAQGDVLIVGLNSDASVKRYKSPDRPIIGESDRAKMLLSLRCVDFVHVFDEDVPMPFLSEIKPDVHVNGSEYGPDCIEAPTVRQNGGRIHIVDKIPGLSTSAVLDRIRALKS